MAFNDSLSDMLARIKNAHQANKVSTLCLKSKLKSIKKSYESYDGFYNYSNFINMINSSFDKNLEPKIMPTENDYVQCEEALSNLMYEN